MEPVGAFLETCRLARKQTHRNLTVSALLGEKAFDPNYLLLVSSLEEGLVEIREIGPVGSLPELRLLNWAERPVLIVEGKELVRAKQDRGVGDATIMVTGDLVPGVIWAVNSGN